MRQVHICANQAELAEACADFIAAAAVDAITQRGQFNVALSGGTTPAATYLCLAQPMRAVNVDWGRVHIFWSDERCVPAEHPDSNYGMSKRTLLDHVAIPTENIHQMHGELQPMYGAILYCQELDEHFGSSALPRFDLILLGLGEDGHTASLLPGTDAVGAGDELVVANYLPDLEYWRLTMTFLLINAARHVAFLVVGGNKARVLKEVLEESSSRLPASAVWPDEGDLDWFVDQAAAGLLNR